MFVRTGTNWSQQAYLKALDAPIVSENISTGLAVSGNLIALSGTLGRSFVFAREGATWTPQASVDGSWNVDVAGDTLVVGGFAYRIVVPGNCSFCLPVFTVQPINQLVLPATNVTLVSAAVSAAAGPGTLHYQWRFESTDIPGATNATYSFTNVSLTNGHGNFSVVVSNEFGTAMSANAFIFVRVPPVIVTPPQPATVLQGQSLTLSVTATGAPPLAYRWLRSATTYVANGAATLELTNLQATTFYRVVVTNLAGSAVSGNFTVTVLPDHDRDGIADSWEVQHGLNTNDAMDAVLDFDADGMINRHEYIGGTHPRDSASVLRLTLSKEGALEFLAQSNVAYSIQHRTNLTLGPWLNFTNVSAEPQRRAVSVNVFESSRPEQFYRLVTPPAP